MADFKSLPQVQGWGADLDPRKRPAYPKERTPPRHNRPNYQPEQQYQRVRILKSIERPTLPHVFGTTLPPSGFSGLIREQAYKYGEAKIHRWLLLLLADRINVVEGLVEDLSRGHIPNVFDEMGLKAELKYNKKAFLKRFFTGVIFVSGLIYFLNQKKNRTSS